MNLPLVELDPKHYKLLDDFEAALPRRTAVADRRQAA